MQNSFGQMMFKTKSIEEKTAKGYKVYKTPTESISVEAATAFEAIEKSGIKNPHKVEKQGIVHKTLFTDAELKDISTGNVISENKPADTVPAENPPVENTPAEATTAENPLPENNSTETPAES